MLEPAVILYNISSVANEQVWVPEALQIQTCPSGKGVGGTKASTVTVIPPLKQTNETVIGLQYLDWLLKICTSKVGSI